MFGSLILHVCLFLMNVPDNSANLNIELQVNGILTSPILLVYVFDNRIVSQNIFEYIRVWYNRQRLHSAVGDLPTAELERHFYDTLAVSKTG